MCVLPRSSQAVDQSETGAQQQMEVAELLHNTDSIMRDSISYHPGAGVASEKGVSNDEGNEVTLLYKHGGKKASDNEVHQLT